LIYYAKKKQNSGYRKLQVFTNRFLPKLCVKGWVQSLEVGSSIKESLRFFEGASYLTDPKRNKETKNLLQGFHQLECLMSLKGFSL
jgi:hypothetical protein